MEIKMTLYKVPVASTAFEGGGAYMLCDTIRVEYYRNGGFYRMH